MLRGTLVITGSTQAFLAARQQYAPMEVRMVRSADDMRGLDPREWRVELREPLPRSYDNIQDWMRAVWTPRLTGAEAT